MGMSVQHSKIPNMGRLPGWVPTAACHYLAHTEAGAPIRELARAADVHASTILRQVRRFETRRDDPLVDQALRDLAVAVSVRTRSQSGGIAMTATDEPLSESKLAREAAPVLRHLSARGAVMAVADGMEMAVVVRDTPDGQTQRCASVPLQVAQAMALKGWVGCDATAGKILRYHITAQGRTQLRAALAADENSALGFAEGQARFAGATPAPTRRPTAPDSPLVALSRRKDKDGQPFLDRALLRAGERLREDFELARMLPEAERDWDAALSDASQVTARAGSGPRAARDRVAAALYALGPGLGDVALRCCCYLEGMEAAEQRMGWSARSGKIVLRIALLQLKRHYDALGEDGDLIG